MNEILNKITRLRLQRSWSEYDLAKKSGIAQSTISGWYRKNEMPKIPSLRKICNGFGITLSQFFSEGEGMVFLTQEQKEMLDHWSALNYLNQLFQLGIEKSKCRQSNRWIKYVKDLELHCLNFLQKEMM